MCTPQAISIGSSPTGPTWGKLDRALFLEAFAGTGLTATTLDGFTVTDAMVASVAEGGAMELLLTAGSRLLNMGRSVRTFTAAQRRAILARDGGCRSCGAPPERCDVHHVIPWEDGGLTDVDNGVAKCRRCHLEHHRKTWVDRLDPDGTYRVIRPDGTEITTRPARLDDQLPLLPVATTSEPARLRPVVPVADTHDPGEGSHPDLIEAGDELVRLRVRHGDADPRTIGARDRFFGLMDRSERAA